MTDHVNDSDGPEPDLKLLNEYGGPDPDPADHLELHFDVFHDELTVAEMTAILGLEPDTYRNRGDRRRHADRMPPEMQTYTASLWSIRSSLPRTACDEDHLRDLWDRVSSIQFRIHDMPGTVRTCLSYNHEMDGRAWQGHGLNLSREWIRLLADIGASVDIDQYIFKEGPA